jgi:flagella basal body P-ring formation protein FlgA
LDQISENPMTSEAFMHAAKRTAAIGFVSWLALLAASGLRAAPEYENHERIRGAAESYAREVAKRAAPTGATIAAEAARLDPRLRLPLCPVALETFSPIESFGGRTTVGVRCPSTHEWSLYVPVRMKITANVVVLAAPMARGGVLSADMLRLDARDVAPLSTGYLTSLSAAEGMVLRRPATPGTVLTPALLERPRLVRRGERVRIHVLDKAISVSSEGEALADASEGDHLKVRNPASGVVIEGVVDASGDVVARW